MRSSVPRRPLAGALAALSVTACSAASPGTVAVPAPSLSAHANQTRPDAAVGGRFQVVVENTGPRPFAVTSLQLVSAGFAPEPPVDEDAEFAPGQRISLPAPFGAVRCDEPVLPAEVAVGLLVEGQQQTQQIPLRSDNGLLERIHAKECAALALAEEVGLALDDELLAVDAADEPGLQGTLTVTRRKAQGPVELVGTRGSVLYDITLPDGPTSLAPDQQAVRVPLLLTSRTCSGHAIGEAKKPYSFLAFLRAGTPEEASAPIPVTPEQQARILAFLDDACPAVTSTP